MSPSDSIVADTSTVVVGTDSTSSAPQSTSSAWLLPITVIAATGGLFILLFTTRSK